MNSLFILMRLLLLAAILCFCGSHTFAQNPKTIDSLQKNLTTDIPVKQKVNILNLIAYEYRFSDSAKVANYAQKAITLAKTTNYPAGISDAYYHLGWITMIKVHYAQALNIYHKALQQAQKSGYAKGVANAYNGMGVTYWRQGKYHKALDFYQRSFKIRKQARDQAGMASSYHNMGLIHEKQGNYPKALKAYRQALVINKKSGNKTTLASSYNDIGGIYSKQGNYDEALNFFHQSLKIKEQINDAWGIAWSYSNIGTIYRKQNQLSAALTYFKKSIKIRKHIGDKWRMGINYDNIGEIYFLQHKYAKALSFFKKSITLKEQIKDQSGIAESHLNLGKLALTQKHFVTAKKHLIKCVQTALETHNKRTARNGFEYLAKVYEATGQYQKALENERLFKKMTDSLLNKKNIQKITQLEEQYKAKKREDSLQQVQSKNTAVLTNTIRRQQRVRNIILIALGLTFILVLFYIQKQQSQRKLQKANQEIVQQQDTLQIKLASLEQIQLLATLGQQITSLLDLDQVFDITYGHLLKQMDIYKLGIGIYATKNEQVTIRFTTGKAQYAKPYTQSISNKTHLMMWCIKHRKSLRINNFENEYQHYAPDYEKRTNSPDKAPASIMYVPLMFQQKIIGAIGVHSFQENAYTDYHFSLFENLSLYVAIAIHNTQVYKEVVSQKEEIRQQKEELLSQHIDLVKSHKHIQLLSSIGKHITSSLDLDKIFHTIYAHINQLMDAENFAIGIYDQQQQQVNFEFAITQSKRVANFTINTKDKNQLITWSIENQQPFKIGNVAEEYSQYVDNIKTESRLLKSISVALPVSAIGIPLVIQDQTVGIIIINSYQKNAYNNYQFSLLKSLSNYIATAIDNAHIYKKTLAQKEEIVKQNNLINLLLNENQHRVGNDFVAMYAKVAAIGEAELNNEAQLLVKQTLQRITEAMELQNLLSYPFHRKKLACDQYEIHDRLHAIAHTLYELHFDKSDVHTLSISNEVQTMDKNRLVMIAFCVFELVKNACKYAFRGKVSDYTASIHIALKDIDGVITLTMKNNGKGFNVDFFDETGAFKFSKHQISKGMNIIQSITSREKGNFSIRTAGVHPEVEEGSHFICTFG